MKRFLTVFLFASALALSLTPVLGADLSGCIGVGVVVSNYVPQASAALGLNSNIGARMVYDNAKAALQQAFSDKPMIAQQAKLTQGALRFSQAMAAGITQYQFPILVNETQLGIFNTETRLNLQDAFIVSELGIFVSNPGSAANAAYRLLTYPNFVEFGAANSAAMLALYNGNLSLTVNNDVLIPKWDIWRHYNTPETQQTAALGAGSANDQFCGEEDCMYPVEPNVVLIGSKNNVLQVTLPASIATVTAFSRIEILVRGVLAQNVTVVS